MHGSHLLFDSMINYLNFWWFIKLLISASCTQPSVTLQSYVVRVNKEYSFLEDDAKVL